MAPGEVTGEATLSLSAVDGVPSDRDPSLSGIIMWIMGLPRQDIESSPFLMMVPRLKMWFVSYYHQSKRPPQTSYSHI